MRTEQAITDEHLRDLLDAGENGGPLVSMILPMERGGPEVRKNAVMFKNALRKSRSLLEQSGCEEAKIKAILEPVEGLVDDNAFWQHQEKSLALYLRPGAYSPFVLSHSFREQVSVGPRFYLTPVLHAAQRQHAAYVLMLSQKHVGMLVLKQGRLEPVKVDGLPANMDEALQLEMEQTLQQHPVSGRTEGGPIMGIHGHGVGTETRLGHLQDFLHRVENPVTRFMEGRGVPLYLATVEENEALYRKINKYSNLAEHGLHGNFDRQSPQELFDSLVTQLEEDLEKSLAARCQEIGNAVAEGNGTADLDKAIEAVWDGRVHACCVALGASPKTGQWDPERRKVSHDPEPDPRHIDLVDFVAAQAWDKGGDVRFVAPELMPQSAEVAVSLRY